MGAGTGTGNLTIRGRGQGWGQTLGDGDRNGDSKLKNGDWGRGRGLKIKKVGTGDGDGDSKLKNGDWGWGRGLVKFYAVPVRPRLSPLVPDCPQLEIQRVFGLKLNRKILIVTGTRSSPLFNQSFDLTLVGPYRSYRGFLLQKIENA